MRDIESVLIFGILLLLTAPIAFVVALLARASAQRALRAVQSLREENHALRLRLADLERAGVRTAESAAPTMQRDETATASRQDIADAQFKEKRIENADVESLSAEPTPENTEELTALSRQTEHSSFESLPGGAPYDRDPSIAKDLPIAKDLLAEKGMARASAPPSSAKSEDPPQKSGLLEALGARWSVFVGGLALALGAILLVRYSIESGFFGPAARCIGGLALGCALVIGGEFLRRRESDASAQGLPVSAIVTAAGVVGVFSSIYAAHALYEFIDAPVAFVAMAATAMGAFFAAGLHGPGLAGLGLVGAMTTPLLVASTAPAPWTVAVYIAFVATSAYAVARLQRWLWLAGAAMLGVLFWAGALRISLGEISPALTLLALTLAAMLFCICYLPNAAAPDEYDMPDQVALAMAGLYALAATAVFVDAPSLATAGMPAVAVFVIILACLSIASILAGPLAGLSGLSALAALAGLIVWAPQTPDELDFSRLWTAPTEPGAFWIFAACAAVAVVAAPLRRVLHPAPLGGFASLLLLASACATPPAVLALLWMRLTKAEFSLPFALIAGGLAVFYTLLTSFSLKSGRADGQRNLQTASFVTAALGALALGALFVLDKGMLTVALAATALVAALCAERFSAPGLRTAAGAFAMLVLARYAWRPDVTPSVAHQPVLINWLLFGYGVPALAFGTAARVLERGQTTARIARSTALMQLAALISAALLVAFEIRHFFRHGDIYAASSSLAEVGCHLVAALGFVFALHRLHARRPSPVFDVGALVATAIAGFLAFAALEPFNPLFNCKEEPGLLLNPLALAYGLPALLFGALYFKTRGARPVAYRNAVGVLALMLSFAYASLQALRLMRAFDAPALCGPIGQFEQWALSALWLAIGVGLLLAGVLRRSLGLRAASACYVLAAVCKAFLYDLSGLSGLPRALSFIVLGLVLIGIGLIYQKLLFARPAGADSAKDIKE